MLEAFRRLFGAKWRCFSLQKTILVSANMWNFNGTFLRFWSNMTISCKFDLFVVNVNVLASLERFPNWQRDVELFLPGFLGIWKPFGSDKLKLRCFGCVLASKKGTRRNSFYFWFGIAEKERSQHEVGLELSLRR